MHAPTLESCTAPFWASSGHAQTVLGHLLPSPGLKRHGERVEIEVDGGDRLVTRLFEGSSQFVIYAFHGLGGSANADYMSRTARLCLAQGHTVCLTNHRGCGEGAGLASQPYHSGRGEDLSRVIEWGRKRFPSKKHLAIGFSLSGNALLCLITGMRGDVMPDFAISVNAPIDLKTAALNLRVGLNRVYDFRFVNKLRPTLLERQKQGHADSSLKFTRWMRLQDIDTLYTGPIGGFGTGENYYATCSTHQNLHKISIPTVLLTAANDPFVSVEAYTGAQLSKTTHLHIEKTGGHMGYINSRPTPFGSKRWLDYALDGYIRALADLPLLAGETP